MNVKDIKTILSSGDVLRYHTATYIKNKQSNSQHQWRAAIILGFIYERPISYNMMMACLLHDFYEIITGDIPSPVKWNYPQIKEVLTKIESELSLQFNMYVPEQQEKDAIKIADCLEMITYLAENAPITSSYESRRILENHIESILNKDCYENDNPFNKHNIKTIIGEYCGK